MIHDIKINNFKSIKNLNLSPKRVNLFIGKPNVGKSNFLECLSIIGNKNPMDVRLENVRNLFYDQDIKDPITISIDKFHQIIRYNTRRNKFESYLIDIDFVQSKLENSEFSSTFKSNSTFQKILDDVDSKFIYNDEFYDNIEELVRLNLVGVSEVSADGKFHTPNILQVDRIPKIKKYKFNRSILRSNDIELNSSSLLSPYGENIFEILKNDKDLLSEVSDLFKEYGYSLIIDFVSNEAEIQKMIGNVGYKIPYSLIADTLQRMVFYIVAIRSNTDATILLEEPENHSFPPYIRDIAFEIINSSNQFFIATHSPYLLNTLLFDTKEDELAINIVSFKEFETKINPMTKEELSELSNYGIDAFFNLNLFGE